jgi:hypothetical protein
MHEMLKQLGEVIQVQVQRDPLKIRTPTGVVYDPVNLVVVPEVLLTPQGVVGLAENGERILDAHHADHPRTRYREKNGISIGLTGHYDRMRARFGEHIRDGNAGENVIIRTDDALNLADLSGALVFENPDGSTYRFKVLKGMAPCDEFSHYVHQAKERLAPDVLKETLQFLDGGTRGFTLELLGVDAARVVPGTQVFLTDRDE